MNFSFSNVQSNSPGLSFNVPPVQYMIDAHGTWGGCNAQLQKLLGDGATYVNVGTAISADGIVADPVYLAGAYKWVITTATGVYIEVTNLVSY